MELVPHLNQRSSIVKTEKARGTTIDDLPPELLSMVLLVELALHRNECAEPSCRGGLQRYLLTSKKWKTLIKGCSLFWTVVDYHDSAGTIAQTLALNPKGPLDLTCRLQQWELGSQTRAETVEDFFSRLVTVRERWRRLDLHGPLTPVALAIIQPAVGAMEECRLNRTLSMGVAALKVEGEEGRLKHLTLFGVDYDWTSTGVYALESLSVDGAYGDVPSPEVLAAALASMPKLQWLRLEIYGRTSGWPLVGLLDHEPQPHPLRTRMPALTWLLLNSLPSQVFRFLLQSIDAPALRYFAYESTEPSYGWLEHPSSPMKVLTQSLLGRVGGPLLLRYIEMESRLRIRSDTSYRESLSSGWDRRGGLLGLNLSMHLPSNPLAWKGLISLVGSLPILPEQCSLELEASGVHTTDRFPFDVLSRLPVVSSLAFTNRWNTPMVFAYLGTPHSDPDENDRQVWPLPRLERLDLAGVEWSNKAEVVNAFHRLWTRRYGENRGSTRQGAYFKAGEQSPVPLRELVVPSEEEAIALRPIVGEIKISVALERCVEDKSRGLRLRR